MKAKNISIQSKAKLPTILGEFTIFSFNDLSSKKQDIALTAGDITDKKNILTRIQSECLTGEVFGSKRCDCRDQLLKSLKLIQREKRGILIYLRQEGRGIGLYRKVKAYKLQDQGLDTVEANQAQCLEADSRNYLSAVEILKCFKIKSIRLLTNNPDKEQDLLLNGIKINKVIPIKIKPNAYNKPYLLTKKYKLGQDCI